MHGICITEKLSGTFNGVDLVSVRYMVGNTPTAIDNGSVVEVGALEANSREVCKATAPKKNSAKAAIALKLFMMSAFRTTLATLRTRPMRSLVAICLRSLIRFLL